MSMTDPHEYPCLNISAELCMILQSQQELGYDFEFGNLSWLRFQHYEPGSGMFFLFQLKHYQSSKGKQEALYEHISITTIKVSANRHEFGQVKTELSIYPWWNTPSRLTKHVLSPCFQWEMPRKGFFKFFLDMNNSKQFPTTFVFSMRDIPSEFP